MKTRYSYGGDEHIFVEADEEMSLDAFFKSLSLTRAVQAAEIDGVTEICPANASLQIKFNPDRIKPQDMMTELQALEQAANNASKQLATRIVEIPVYYQDPWTQEVLMRFRDRHQNPNATDLEYAAQINGFNSVAEFITAHHTSPWFVSMVGFVAGLPFLYQLVGRDQQLQVPKYLRPRTDTPKQTVGYGGCFSCVYSVRGAGGYQMFGITPMTIYDPSQTISYLREFLVFFKPGDLVKWKPIEREEYETILAEVAKNTYQPTVKPVTFELDKFNADISGYNTQLLEVLHGS